MNDSFRSPPLRLLLLLCLLSLAAGPAAAADKPNIVILLCDDLGYGDLSCFAHPTILTPNLDKLAAEGVKLTHCYSSAPVCSPSRAGLLTGRVPNRLGIRNWIPANSGVCLRPGETTLARLLKDAGYRTCHAGKWHLNSKTDGSEPTPGDAGFDHWLYTQNNAAPNHLNPTNFVRNGKPAGRLDGPSSHIVVAEALRFLEAEPGKPFFLNLWFHESHEPVAAAAEFLELYPKEDNPDRRHYSGDVSQVDAAVGKLLKYLDEHKLRDNTLVFFSSDNGPETLKRYKGAERSYGSPGPLRGMKLHITEAGYRVPGIVRWTGHTKAGTVSAEPGGHPVDGTLNWSSGFMPSLYQGTVLRPQEPRILNLDPPPHLRGEPQRQNLEFLAELNRRHLRRHPGEADLEARIASYELAAAMQTAAKEALDVSKEPASIQQLYGLDQEVTRSYGTRCLIARRLVERGVRFVQLFLGGQPWDTHNHIRKTLPDICHRTDRPVAALVQDLKQRGLLDSTIVHWGGEIGRLPVCEGELNDTVGRDHNGQGFSIWLAGGGIKGGMVYGATDEVGHRAAVDVVTPNDYQATIFHLLGLDHGKLVYHHNGRELRLTDGRPARLVKEILA